MATRYSVAEDLDLPSNFTQKLIALATACIIPGSECRQSSSTTRWANEIAGRSSGGIPPDGSMTVVLTDGSFLIALSQMSGLPASDVRFK